MINDERYVTYIDYLYEKPIIYFNYKQPILAMWRIRKMHELLAALEIVKVMDEDKKYLTYEIILIQCVKGIC